MSSATLRSVIGDGRCRRVSRVGRVGLVGLLVFGVVLRAATATAQTVNICVNKKTGALRGVTSSSKCKKSETFFALNQQGPPGPQGPQGPAGVVGSVLSVQQLNLVNAQNVTVASLGQTSQGTFLTFLDSSGKVTLTIGNNTVADFEGMVAWDGNSIIPGTGIGRVSLGASNPSGFGGSILDGTGKTRATFGLTYDGTGTGFNAFSVNGSETTLGAFENGPNEGLYVYDLNEKLRVQAGIALNGTTYDGVFVSDPTGLERTGINYDAGNNFQGFFTRGANGESLSILGNALDGSFAFLNLLDSSGTNEVKGYASGDGSQSGVIVQDTNGNERVSNTQSGSSEGVAVYNSGSSEVGHVP